MVFLVTNLQRCGRVSLPLGSPVSISTTRRFENAQGEVRFSVRVAGAVVEHLAGCGAGPGAAAGGLRGSGNPKVCNSGPGTSLEDFYHQDAQALAARERERFERHYLQPAQQAGFKYTGVELQAEFKSIKVEGATAQVGVIVDVAYTSGYPNDPCSIMTKEAGLEHVISLVYQGNQWYITADRYFDMFSKRGRRGPGVPLLNDDEVPDASPEDTALEGVAPLWYHYYNRAGAVAYADTWWNSHNPKL